MLTLAYKEGNGVFAIDEYPSGLAGHKRPVLPEYGQPLLKVATEDFGRDFSNSPEPQLIAAYETHYQFWMLVSTKSERSKFMDKYKALSFRDRLAFSGYNYGHKGDTARMLGYHDVTTEESYLGDERSASLNKRERSIRETLLRALEDEQVIGTQSDFPLIHPEKRLAAIITGIESEITQVMLPEPDSQIDYIKKWTEWGHRRQRLLYGSFLNP